ncbi:sensor histidine kinase [Algicola sagamiensis]|uniref:sensor histidine kinase n=1 Tax=Algicola sagamiensis TaxID=163869 RepID=UPI000475DA9D|nr:histidine kinase [Algicola sagamiensis]
MNWKHIIENRNQFFWLLHTAGWLSFAVIQFIGYLVVEKRDVYLIVVALDAYAGWLLTLPLRYCFRRVWNEHPVKLIVSIFVTSLVITIFWTVVKVYNLTEIYQHGFQEEPWNEFFHQGIGSFYIILCWSGLYFGIKYYLMLQTEKQKALIATTQAHEAQLKMLRYQLNPHFLFNTLNAISTLVLMEDTKTANAMVTRLSDFLRYTLKNDPIQRVPLSNEIEALKLYLEIEQVRFEERLKVIWEIDELATDALVPSLILQPIIENAIKYAIATTETGGELSVKAQRFGRDLLIEVADNGPGIALVNGELPKTESGVGLKNMYERLESLYETDYSFSLTNNLPNGLKVNIRIPYQVKS